MKVAIIGTHGTGKTELVNELHRLIGRKYKVAIIPEQVRFCPFIINSNTSLEGQLWILFKQIEEEMKMERKDDIDIILCDRGIADNFIYLKRKFTSFADTIEDFVIEYSKKYDLIFKTGIEEGQIPHDGFRSTDEAFRQEIETFLNNFLVENKIPFHAIPKEGGAGFVIRQIESRMRDNP